jgi:CyaY protein
LNETEFTLVVDHLFLAIEEALDDSGADIDYENSGGIITITCEANGSQIILSRQPAIGEVWVAAKSGGFHLKQAKQDWVCGTTGENLPALLSRVLSEQCGESVAFELPC